MNIEPYGENGVRIIFGNEINADIHKEVRTSCSMLTSAKLEGVVEIVPSFVSCLLIFDPRITSYEKLLSAIGEAHARGDIELPPPAMHEIPVVYGGEYGPDLEFVSEYCGLTEEDVIGLHTASVYTVYAVGFMPGFPYLGPLDRKLFTPRLETPRLKVPEGSVGLAQLQTGIYTFESPGGWRIIGKTNWKLFHCESSPYSLLKLGDRVRFVEE
jgi:inhibitor of KinA